MGYDWEKIFRNTSSQELYQIYTGQIVKSKESVLYAKKELDRRGFDFSDMKKNRDNWDLLNMRENEIIDQSVFSFFSTISYISFKKYILIVVGILVFFCFLIWYDDVSISEDYSYLIVFIIAIALSGIFVIINNLVHKHQVKKINERERKPAELKKLANQHDENFDNTVLQEDIRIKTDEMQSVIKSQIMIIVIILTIDMLTMVYRMFIK